MPGVCSRESIQGNHRMMDQPGAKPGQITGNPIREDMEEAGRMAGLAFIVNAVLNSRQEMVKTVAGDRIQAHREGIKYVDRMYRRAISRLADIAVASCGGFPKDQSLYQAQKDWKTPARWSGKGNHHPSGRMRGNVWKQAL